jgi:hypothetical protein
MLCSGDLNARTSCEVDFILNDGPSYLPLFDSYKPDDQIKLRKSHDDVLDESLNGYFSKYSKATMVSTIR